MSLIEFKDVSLGYNDNVIVNNLTFNVENGDYLYIVGKNGVGKSTLIKTLLGFVDVISGQIKFSKEFNKKQIGYLPQQAEIKKDFPATVKEIVQAGCINQSKYGPLYNKKSLNKVEGIMEKLGITDLSSKSFNTLSGGQRQKVLLARALCATGKILLLDEPITGLDPKASEQMYELIEKINREGKTIIMISHDMSNINQYASKILHLDSEKSYIETNCLY